MMYHHATVLNDEDLLPDPALVFSAPDSAVREIQALEDEGVDLVEIIGGDKPVQRKDKKKAEGLLSRSTEEKGVNLLDILVDPRQKNDRVIREKTEKLIKHATGEFLADLLFTVTYQRFNPDEAKRLWQEILEHKWQMSEQLNRNVGIRIAAVDYLTNAKGLLRHVRLLSEDSLDQIMIFANVDGLTALYNHRYFQEHLTQEIERAHRYRQQVSLLLIDVDDFKEHNDTFGHMVGDVILRQIGKVIRLRCRKVDIPARYGGDEFAIILPGASRFRAVLFARRIHREIHDSVLYRTEDGMQVKVSLSVGVAGFPNDAQNKNHLISAADQALYLSKKQGRNRVSMYGQTIRPRTRRG